MLVIQFILLLSILILGYAAGSVLAEEMNSTPPKKKSLILPVYGDESPEEVARMIEEAKTFNNPLNK